LRNFEQKLKSGRDDRDHGDPIMGVIGERVRKKKGGRKAQTHNSERTDINGRKDTELGHRFLPGRGRGGDSCRDRKERCVVLNKSRYLGEEEASPSHND